MAKRTSLGAALARLAVRNPDEQKLQREDACPDCRVGRRHSKHRFPSK